MKEVRKLITDLAFNYYEHGSKLDTIIPEADIDPIIKYIGDNFVSRVELPAKPANGVSREDKIMELLQDFWDEHNNNKAVVWLRNDNTGQLAIYTRGEYANDLIQFISRLSV